MVDTSEPSWPGELRAAHGGALDLVLDSVGGEPGLELVQQLAPGGVLVHYGLLSGRPLPADCFLRPDARVEMFRLRDVVHASPRPDLTGLMEPVWHRIAAGGLRTRVAHRVPLSMLPGALRDDRLDAPGKVLVDCQG